MNAEDVCFVVNPRSAGGRTAARLNELEREVARRFSNATVQLTRGPGDAEARARDAVRDGASVVVAVGGDGTASEVVNGLAGAPSATVFAVLPAGTGCDLVRTLEMPRDLGACLDVIASAPARPVDVVEVQATTPGGVVKRRCINVAGFGVNGEVVARANRSRKLLGGKLTFLLSTARAMATWAGPTVDVSWTASDGSYGSWTGPLSAAFIANGAYCGGGMWVGPGGAMDDGALDLLILPHRSLAVAALQSRHLYDGTLDRVAGAVVASVTHVTAASVGGPILVDVDGEQPGILPLTASVVPKALMIRAFSTGGR